MQFMIGEVSGAGTSLSQSSIQPGVGHKAAGHCTEFIGWLGSADVSTGAALMEVSAQSKAVGRAILSKQNCSASTIIFFLELPIVGRVALVVWMAFWKENVVIFLEKRKEKVQLLKRKG